MSQPVDPLPLDLADPPEPVPPPPAQQAQVEIETRLVLATGFFPSGSPDPETIEIVDLDEQQWADFQEAPPGRKYLAADGTLTVEPLGIDYARIAAQRQAAEATAQAELLAMENPDYLVILKASGGL